jgi:uncharacterized membrane protein YkoI
MGLPPERPHGAAGDRKDRMTSRIRKVLTAAGLVAVFALGGAAVASAVSDGADTASSSTAATTPAEPPADAPAQRAGETALTGETAAKVESAALAEVAGGTVERVETDADGNAAYEAHVVKSDGTRVTVYVDESFAVVSVEVGGPGGDCPRGQDGGGAGSQGDTGTQESDTAAT